MGTFTKAFLKAKIKDTVSNTCETVKEKTDDILENVSKKELILGFALTMVTGALITSKRHSNRIMKAYMKGRYDGMTELLGTLLGR